MRYLSVDYLQSTGDYQTDSNRGGLNGILLRSKQHHSQELAIVSWMLSSSSDFLSLRVLSLSSSLDILITLAIVIWQILIDSTRTPPGWGCLFESAKIHTNRMSLKHTRNAFCYLVWKSHIESVDDRMCANICFKWKNTIWQAVLIKSHIQSSEIPMMRWACHEPKRANHLWRAEVVTNLEVSNIITNSILVTQFSILLCQEKNHSQSMQRGSLWNLCAAELVHILSVHVLFVHHMYSRLTLIAFFSVVVTSTQLLFATKV